MFNRIIIPVRDIPRLCRARGRAPRGVVPPHVAAEGPGRPRGRAVRAVEAVRCGVGVGCGVSAVFTQQSTLRA